MVEGVLVKKTKKKGQTYYVQSRTYFHVRTMSTEIKVEGKIPILHKLLLLFEHTWVLFLIDLRHRQYVIVIM